MNSRLLSINRGEIDVRRIFWLLVVFETIAMLIILLGDIYEIAYFAAIVFLPTIFLLIPIEPVLGIPLMFIATGFDFFAQIIKSENEILNLTYFHIVMVVTFASVFLNSFLKRKITFPSISLWAPLIAFLTMTLISTLYTPNFFVGFLEFVRLLVLSILAFAILISIDSIRRVKFVVWSYILIPLGVAIFTIYEILTQGAFFSSQVARVATELGIPVYRSTGTFHNPNDLACFLMIGISLSFAVLIIENAKIYTKIMMIVIIGITSFALIASFSRGGWLSTFVAVAFIVILQRKWSYAALFGGVFILTLIVLSVKFPHIILSALDRFGSIINPFGEASSSSRISLIRTGIWMWHDHPIFGVGGGGFSYYAFDYIDPDMPRMVSSTKQAHTLQVKILAEQGLVGFSIAVWFFFTVLFDGIRSIRTMKDIYLKKIQIGFVALFVGFIANFTFASDMHNNIFWITVGVIYAIPLVYQNMLGADHQQSNNSTLSLKEDSS
ncbi:O-antigen ligase family protein [Candidatus Latescibacterota bacterium]